MNARMACRRASLGRRAQALHAVAAASVCELVHGRPGAHRGDRGATATEYAILVSMIALVIIGAVTVFGQNVIPLFNVPSSIFSNNP